MTGREIRTLDGAFGGGSGLSLETIKELQVITSGFKAETGQTGAGTISVVTKSGTNRFEGTVFGYFRPSGLVGDNPITGARRRSRIASSGAASWAARSRRDETHFFGAWESTRDQRRVGGHLGAGARARSRTKSHINQGFGRVDHRFNQNNVLDARYSLTRNGSENGGVGGLNTFDRRTNNESQSDTFVTLARHALRLEQGERGAGPLHLQHRRHLFAAHRRQRRRVAHAGLLNRAGVGQPRRRRQLGPTPALPQNLVEKRAAVRQQLLDRHAARTSGSSAATSSSRGASSPSSTTSPAPTRSRTARRSRSTPATRRRIPSSSRRASATPG